MGKKKKDTNKGKWRAHSTKGAIRRETGRIETRVVLMREGLKEVWISIDPATRTNSVTFVTTQGNKYKRRLTSSKFFHGDWLVKVKTPEDETGTLMLDIVKVEGTGIPEKEALELLSDEDVFATFASDKSGATGAGGLDPVIWNLWESAVGKEIWLRVAPVSEGVQGSVSAPKSKPLSDDHLQDLKHPVLAQIFLRLVEHFSVIEVTDQDWATALDGLTRKERRVWFKKKGKNSKIPPRLVAQVVTGGFREYLAALAEADSDDVEWFAVQAMLETILEQRKRGNPHALHNQLEIGLGMCLGGGFGSVGKTRLIDLGIRLRGVKNGWLLYTRLGVPVLFQGVYWDNCYRVIKLDTIDAHGDPSMLAQTIRDVFAYPTLQAYHVVDGFVEFLPYISKEIVAQWNMMRFGKVVLEFSLIAIGFLVAHALAAFFMAVGQVPIAAAIIIAARALGYIMGVSYGMLELERIREAGYHFSRLQEVHSQVPGEIAKKDLSQLSRVHLETGTRVLVELFYDLAGLAVVGGGAKLLRVKASRRKSDVTEIHSKEPLEIVSVEKIRARDEKMELPSTVAPVSVSGKGKLKPSLLTTKTHGEVTGFDVAPTDGSGHYSGKKPAKPVAPKPRKVLTVVEALKGKFIERSEWVEKSGTPLEVLDMLVDALSVTSRAAGSTHVAAVRRSSIVKAWDYIKKHGRELAVKDSKYKDFSSNAETGFVTAKGKKQIRRAKEMGFDLNRNNEFIDPVSKKKIPSDVDFYDVFELHVPRRGPVLLPKSVETNVSSGLPKKVIGQFNAEALAKGYPKLSPHGTHRDLIQRRAFTTPIPKVKGPILMVFPDGRIAYVPEAKVKSFYKDIDRNIFELSDKELEQIPWEERNK